MESARAISATEIWGADLRDHQQWCSQYGAKRRLCELRTPYSPEHPRIADGARKLVQGRCGGAKWILAEPRTVLQPRAEMEDRNEQFGSILDDLDAC